MIGKTKRTDGATPSSKRKESVAMTGKRQVIFLILVGQRKRADPRIHYFYYYCCFANLLFLPGILMIECFERSPSVQRCCVLFLCSKILLKILIWSTKFRWRRIDTLPAVCGGSLKSRFGLQLGLASRLDLINSAQTRVVADANKGSLDDDLLHHRRPADGDEQPGRQTEAGCAGRGRQHR